MKTDASQFALVADIGGTHCRFALSPMDEPVLEAIVSKRCDQYADLNEALSAYLDAVNDGISIAALCLAVPGPAHTDSIRLVNNPWRHLEVARLRQQFSVPVHVFNDFAAQALSLSALNEDDLDRWQEGSSNDSANLTRAVIGPGTGLGSALFTAQGQVIASEAGHMSFAPTTARQRQLLDKLCQVLPRVYNEALVSGPGLANIHRGLSLIQGQDTQLSAEQITQRAQDGDRECQASVKEFSRIFGAICGDLALAYGAVGGVYLSGGLLPAMGESFDRSAFLDSFAAKGSYREYCLAIPIARIVHPYPGLLGAASFLKRNKQN